MSEDPAPFSTSEFAYLELARPKVGLADVVVVAGCAEELAVEDEGPAPDSEPARPDCEGMAGIGAALELAAGLLVI